MVLMLQYKVNVNMCRKQDKKNTGNCCRLRALNIPQNVDVEFIRYLPAENNQFLNGSQGFPIDFSNSYDTERPHLTTGWSGSKSHHL